MGERRTCREIGLGAAQQTLALSGGDGLGGPIEIGAPLDLDEGDDLSLTGDDIDLAPPARRRGKAAFENAIALEAQEPGRDKFGAAAQSQGG